MLLIFLLNRHVCSEHHFLYQRLWGTQADQCLSALTHPLLFHLYAHPLIDGLILMTMFHLIHQFPASEARKDDPRCSAWAAAPQWLCLCCYSSEVYFIFRSALSCLKHISLEIPNAAEHMTNIADVCCKNLNFWMNHLQWRSQLDRRLLCDSQHWGIILSHF